MHGFTKDQVATYQEVFNTFDTDGSGSISTSELSEVLKKVKQEATEAQVAQMIKEFDSDGNGTLEFEEFLAMLWNLQNGPNEKEIRAEMFSVSTGYCPHSLCAAHVRTRAAATRPHMDVSPHNQRYPGALNKSFDAPRAS